MDKGVSVIICCFNSALVVKETINHIAEQIFADNIECELILVNNASTDNTVRVALSAWGEKSNTKIKFRIVDEPEPGLANARKKGINEASYEYIIFCDDDNRLDRNYVSNVFTIFNQNPAAAVLGGTGIAAFESGTVEPWWFKTFYHGYAVGAQAEKEGIVNAVYGAGMAVRKTILKQVTENQHLFLDDRKQNQLSSGGDSEICFRARLAGYHILFSPRLKFKHLLVNKRLNWGYVKKLHTGLSKSFVVLNLYEIALNSDKIKLPPFYWLKKALYYCGIYLKYWPTHYSRYAKAEGTVDELHHITWKNIAISCFKYNFKTISIYRKIIALKK